MMTAHDPPSGSIETRPSQQSLRGLDWFNFFLAGVLTGFGPFVTLHLAKQSWTKEDIGFILTISVLTGLLLQVPSGELLDMVKSKRPLVALGVATISFAALILALWPNFIPVLIAELLLGVAGGFLGQAVGAISLGVVGHDGLPERLGRNQRFSAIGGFCASGLMGVLGDLLSTNAIFFASAALALPALVALYRFRGGDIHFARASSASPGDYHPARPPRTARAAVGANYRLIIFGSCIVLFQLANASLMPLVSEELAREHGSSLVVSALISVPQIVVAILAPRVGSEADRWGRRPLLLIGLGALPIDAACLAFVDNPLLLVAAQTLSGISGVVIGVLTPLIVADITKGTGRFNLGQGIVGTVSGIGAALSTTVSGIVAQSFGAAAGFYAMAGVALLAVAVCWAFMPETRATPSKGAKGETGKEGGESGYDIRSS
jgi:MFS family permease